VFELAFRLKDPDAIRLIETVICSFDSTGLLVRGTEILHRIERASGRAVDPGLLYDLIDGGMLQKRHPSKDIEDYLFQIDFEKTLPYFEKEAFAAEVIHHLHTTVSFTKPLEISFAATVPSEFTDVSSEFEDIYPALIRLAAEAKHELWIINPFFDDYGATCLLPSMIGAAKNDVKVRILGRQIIGYQAEGFNKALKCIASRFIEEGLASSIEIRDFFRQDEEGHLVYGLHTKMMLSDSSMAYIGSANLTRHSLRNNFEIGVILKGPDVHLLVNLTRNLWLKAKAVDLKNLV
jgi:phosphatidylserine/phosphatidylglycerophosphate/cardiolipin synthase-like enzyme